MTRSPGLDPDTRALADEVAAGVSDFLQALRAIAAEGEPGPAIPLLLLEVSQVLLAGARLGVQTDFTPAEEFQPDVGPDADLDDMRLRLAQMLDSVDTYSFVFDPYAPEVLHSQLSDDLTSIATDLDNGLRHYNNGDVAEALWWWQFSYLQVWGDRAASALRVVITLLTHLRMDVDDDVAREAEANALRSP